MAIIEFVDATDPITLDESFGDQNKGGVGATSSEDNNDDDFVGTLPQAFTDRLTALSASAFFPGDETRGMEAASSGGTYLTFSTTGTITNLFFADKDGNYLDGTAADDSGLDAVVGGDIYLQTDGENDNIVLGIINGGDYDGQIAFAAYLEEEKDLNGNIVGASIYVVTYTAIVHTGTTDPDDVASLFNESLFVAVNESIKFNLNTLASGQNDWNWFGDQVDPDPTDPEAPLSYQVIVIADTLGQTVNTSKGGGQTTIGNSNQLMNGEDLGKDADGEAMVFTFVKNSADELLAGDLSNIDTVNYDSLQTANTGKWSISQTQGGADYAVATMAAYSTAPEITTQFFSGIGDGDDFLVDITYVKIEGAGDFLFEATYTGIVYDGVANVFTFEDRTVGKGKNADVFNVTITFKEGGDVEIVGLRAKDSITYFTEDDHSRLILQNTGIEADTLPWDIGGFELLDGAVTPFDISPQIKIEDAGPEFSPALFDAVQEDALDTEAPNFDLSTGIPDSPDDTTIAEIRLLDFVQSGTDFPPTFTLVNSTDPIVISAGPPEVLLTSKGEVVTTSVNSGGDVVTGTATDGTETWTVFTITLETRNDGTQEEPDLVDYLVFQLKAQVDHSGTFGALADNETLSFDLSDYLVVTDAEGDKADLIAALTATVENDVPEETGATESVKVVEDELSTSAAAPVDLSDGITDGDAESDENSGNLSSLVTSGADDPAIFSWTNVGSLDNIWTSKGDDVTWSTSGTNNEVLVASAGGRTILTVTLTTDTNGDYTGAYDVDLLDQWDHTGAGDDETLKLGLTSIVKASDFDGDMITLGTADLEADRSTFEIVIENDVPEETGATESVKVVEDELSTSAAAPVDLSDGITDGDAESDENSGNLSSLVTSGADDPAIFSWTNVGSLDNIWTSKGDDVTWSTSGTNNEVLVASAGGRTILTVTLTTDTNGDYTGAYDVDLLDQWDHTGAGDDETLKLDLTSIVKASDFDGDMITLGTADLEADRSTFEIVIENDVPEETGATESVKVVEDELSTSAAAPVDLSDGITDGDAESDENSGNLSSLVTSGADDPAIFSWTNVGSLDNIWTSKGDDVTWSTSGTNNEVLVASAGGRTILTVTLTTDTNGDYTGAYDVDLLDQWDHTGAGDDETLKLGLTSIVKASDFDGDMITLGTADLEADRSTFEIVIENDVPEETGATESVKVVEDELSTSAAAPVDLSDGITDGDAESDENSGNLSSLVTSGADDPAIFSWTNVGSLDNIWTSKGDDVTWSTSGTNNEVLVASAGGRTILTVTLTTDTNGDYTGAYDVDLLDQWDHTGAGDDETLKLGLTSIVKASDFDGDMITLGTADLEADRSTFEIVIENDVPEETGATESVKVVEDELSTSAAAPVDLSDGITDGDAESDENSGNLSSLVTSGADDPAIFSWTNVGSLDNIWTSKGDDVTWSTSGTNNEVLVASAGGRTILTVTLTTDTNGDYTGAYDVDLLDQWDHTGAGDDETLKLDLTSIVKASDFDGDMITLGTADLEADRSTFEIVIENDVPDIGTIADLTIDFTSIDGPNPNEADNDSTKSATTTIPSSSGADEPSSFAFVDSTIEVSVVDGLTTAIVDDGDRVVWYVDDGTEGYIEGDDARYFDATINQTTGEITFESYRDPEPPELEFDFSGFPAGNQIYGVFGPTSGGTSDALLIAPDGLVLKANGTLNNSQSTTLNSSLSDGSITALAVSNNSINPGEVLNFVSIASPPSDIVVGAAGFDGGNYKDADSLAYTGTIERTGASVEVAQTTPNGSLVDLQITAYDIADDAIAAGTADDGYLQDLSGGGTGVKIDTVTVYDGVADAGGVVVAYFVWDPTADGSAGAFVNADSPLDAPQDDDAGAIDILPGMTVTEAADGGIIITNVADDFVIEWTQEDDADLWAVENVDGDGDGLDIGGFNFTQAQPTPDQWFTAQVEVTDADGDTDLAVASNFYVDGTGIYDNDQFLII